jgi:REP element-mobilizing transposase RayT
MSIPREKHHRLQPELYRGFQSVSFTARLLNDRSYFTTTERFKEHEKHIRRALKEELCESEVYLFMPDHLHVIITGTNDLSDPLAAMKRFKQYSGYALSQVKAVAKWQKDFYDHIIREDESKRNQMIYILNNPIRKGLCSTWDEYPYKGSTIFDLNKFK